MMFRHCLITFAITTAAFVSPAFAAEKVPSPQYASWAKYKPGTTVTLKQTMKTGAMTMEAETHYELKEVTSEAVTVEMWSTSKAQGMEHGTPKRQSASFPSTIEKGAIETPPGFDGKIERAGEEKVTVGGKEYGCEVTRLTTSFGGTKSEGKIWASDSVPGRTVKMETKLTGTTEMTVIGELANVTLKE